MIRPPAFASDIPATAQQIVDNAVTRIAIMEQQLPADADDWPSEDMEGEMPVRRPAPVISKAAAMRASSSRAHSAASSRSVSAVTSPTMMSPGGVRRVGCVHTVCLLCVQYLCFSPVCSNSTHSEAGSSGGRTGLKLRIPASVLAQRGSLLSFSVFSLSFSQASFKSSSRSGCNSCSRWSDDAIVSSTDAFDPNSHGSSSQIVISTAYTVNSSDASSVCTCALIV